MDLYISVSSYLLYGVGVTTEYCTEMEAMTQEFFLVATFSNSIEA